MDIQVRKYSFESKFDGVVIRGVCMIPEKPVAILQMVHGMCEHKNRYLSFMRTMAEKGYITVMHDNRGHGESVKQQDDIGYCYDSMEAGLVADVYKVSQQMKKAYPGLPLILYGHSMGSLIARTYLRNHDNVIDGLIVAGGPSYNSMVPLALWVVRCVKKMLGARRRSLIMQNVVLGGFQSRFMKEGGKYAWLAANQSVAEEFCKDPLCTFTYTLNGFETLLNLEYITYRAIGYQMENERLPILFVSGMDDPCYVNESGWKQAIERMLQLGYQDVREIRYENMRHEIHNEIDNAQVFDDLDMFCQNVVVRYKKTADFLCNIM